MQRDTLIYKFGPWICNFCLLAHLETPGGTQMLRCDVGFIAGFFILGLCTSELVPGL